MTTIDAATRRFDHLGLALGAALVFGANAARGSELSFEPNLGQTDPEARFLARGPGYVVFLTPREAVLALPEAGAPLRMRLAGAQEPALTGEGLLEAKNHYFLGSDPARWRTDVPSYERVRYDEVYPGIDLVFYGNEGELEYDFEIAAGADPRKVAMDFSGATAMRVDDQGDLVLTTGVGPVVWRKPVAYQVRDGKRRAVECRYAVRGKRRMGFQVGAYDRKLPLVVDPTLSYSTYLGGSGNDIGHAIAVDEAGNAYVAGETASVNFPGTGTLQGLGDAFVTKFNASGTTRLYSVYVGGNGIDIAWGIAVDAASNVHLTGDTLSTNFPTTQTGFQRVKDAGRDAFVLKLGATGALAYSTYLGGDSPDEGDRGNAIVVDAAGNMVVTGRTDSFDFPTTAGVVFPFFRGEVFDAFVAKLNPAASGAASLVYSTYLGGQTNDAGFGIALDVNGNTYVAGGTNSGADFPTLNAYQPSGNLTDAFFTKLNANATALLYSTFLGGSGTERANAIVVDAAFNATITGQTNANDFPTRNPVQSVHGGGYDAFVARFNPAADGDASLLYSTYIGGSGDESGRALGVDTSGRVYVSGQTSSSVNFPIVNAVQPTFGGGTQDAFLTRLNAAGTSILYSTYLGGSGNEGVAPNGIGGPGQGLAISSCGDAWVTGGTLSTNFPTANPAQALAGGEGDAFVAKVIEPDPPTVLGVVPQWGPISGGSGVTIVGNCFRPGATATFGGTAATGVTVVSATAITATTPAHAAGPVDVVVTNPGLPPTTRTNGFTYGATGFFSLPPCRVLDTRNPTGALGGPALGAGADRTFTVQDVCGIPATAGAVSVNVTVTQGTFTGDIRLRPGGTPIPLVSSINYGAGQTRANNATVPLGPGGTITVRSAQAAGTVHFVLDVNGYYQ